VSASVGDLAKAIEHTLLVAAATPTDIDRLCDEAAELGVHGVCVNPAYVARASARLQGQPVCVVSVAAFPLGASHGEVAAREARRAVSDGAAEVDLVIPVGLALAREFAAVTRFVRAVRVAIESTVLKVILETGHFDRDTLVELAGHVLDAGPDFLKTSTGFGPRGATVEDVRLLAEVASGRARIKAAGGIRTAEQARAMLSAGATRLGTSSSPRPCPSGRLSLSASGECPSQYLEASWLEGEPFLDRVDLVVAVERGENVPGRQRVEPVSLRKPG
jgi:deoxyribose-phosphate aldolase